MRTDYYVYEHIRPDTGKPFYIGMGRTRRANIMGHRNRLHADVQEYLRAIGMKPRVEIFIDGLTRSQAYSIEVVRIAFWKFRGVELTNLNSGGAGSHELSAESRAMQSRLKKGKKLRPEHREKVLKGLMTVFTDPEIYAKMRAASAAGTRTPEAKEKASKHFKEMVRSPEHCAKIAASKTGLKQSAEHREKTIRASLGRKQTPEEIEKRRVANTGKKRSPEFCQQMRELNRRPDLIAAKSSLMKEINSRPEIREANRQRTIARNKSRTGEKRPRKQKEKDLT